MNRQPDNSADQIKPQTITRTIPAQRNVFTGERTPERTYEDRTGWWEGTTADGLHSLATTPRGAQAMIDRMRANRGVCNCDIPRPVITAWTCSIHGYVERRP